MKRFHLFEFEDLAWFPDILRRNMMDFLRFSISTLRIYDPVVPLLQKIIPAQGPIRILDLCSGGGGGILGIQQSLQQTLGQPVQIILSDKFPNIPAFEWVASRSGGAISYKPEPVDATAVPQGLPSCRTIFSAFHHFRPKVAQAILADAARQRVPIGVFEGAGKSYWEIITALLLFPIIFLLVTPFIRPFRFSRLFFTYLIPLIPLFTMWDGVVSILRLYDPEYLARMTAAIPVKDYKWEMGRARHQTGAKVIYLIGYPADPPNAVITT